jgi:hypothetical protein
MSAYDKTGTSHAAARRVELRIGAQITDSPPSAGAAPALTSIPPCEPIMSVLAQPA